METHAEVARLRQVYHDYAVCGYGETKWSDVNKGNLAIESERQLKAQTLLRQSGFFPLTGRRVLDVGCGSGEKLGLFEEWGARPEHLFGIDLMPDRIAAARRKFPQFSFQVANAESLPFADGAFDLAAVFTVFTSILDSEMALNVGHEIVRVLAPGGAVLWYDFRLNNPFNKHVRGISRQGIRRLFPGFDVTLEAISLLPPLARRLGVCTDRLYAALSILPFLRTHLIGLLTKP